MAIASIQAMRSRTGAYASVWLAACLPLTISAARYFMGNEVCPLSAETLATVSGGAAGNCCVAGFAFCNGIAAGCQNSRNKCPDAYSCPKGNQQINRLTNNGSRFQFATCSSATGSLNTKNLAQLLCYTVVKCPTTCTKTMGYFHCDGGAFVANGQYVTPTVPDNTVCP